jgi:diguanylate cyclase (GGDEF)-like protein/putative nucleotidyltransferase with HDIG domain
VFGAPSRVRRPVLLLIVFGVFLVIVGVTATAQTVIVTTNVSHTSLEAVVESDAATVRTFANLDLLSSDLDPATITGERRTKVQNDLATIVSNGQILHVEVRLPDGRVILSDRPEPIGQLAASSPDFAAAARGAVRIAITSPDSAEAVATPFSTGSIVREYFPIQTDRTDKLVVAVVALWRDAAPILDRVEAARWDVVVVTLSAALVAAFVLFLVFRASQGRIDRQTVQLVEASRRDALTGTLNHGTLVGMLAEAIEHARASGSEIGVAVVDIDDFRLLNETHGHVAGDDALHIVAEELSAALPPEAEFGRYGPDEFMVMVPAEQVAALEPAIDRLRVALVDRALQFDDSERLPITISGGICTFPRSGQSLSAILTTAAITLNEARVSGGDAVRVAGLEVDTPPETRTFDVFQGLILAVDTKDRYTKRHSEDVARYAAYLAERLGLDPAEVATVRVAGLLHDVGKIGIPDAILRKPGRLSDAELAVVKQHVTLGDMIVRDLPDIDAIRAGVRHHHEHWDGTGYLHALAGQDIPLIARILAVGDAFSAMTTTRPYRKALGVREALIRLGDAAGTQLDEELVGVFLSGIERDPAAPLPGIDMPHGRLWTPYSKVA